jgi:hypothetical protein
MANIARGLFSVFVADMEMHPQALFLPFKPGWLILHTSWLKNCSNGITVETRSKV